MKKSTIRLLRRSVQKSENTPLSTGIAFDNGNKSTTSNIDGDDPPLTSGQIYKQLRYVHKQFVDSHGERKIDFCPMPGCDKITFPDFDSQFEHIYRNHLDAGRVANKNETDNEIIKD